VLGAGAAEIVIGSFEGRRIALAVTGDGARNAQAGISALFAALEVEGLIAIGVAGALSADLAEGAVVVAEQVLQEQGGAASWRADEDLLASALRTTGAKRAVVVTAGRIADSVTEKQRLHRLVLAPQGGMARPTDDAVVTTAVVDLESASYVSAAVERGVPWTVLRAVSDTADEGLPALLNRSRDEGGAVRRGSVVRGLLTDPGVLPALLGLRRRVQHCANLLSRTTAALLMAPPTPVRRTSPSNHGEEGEPVLGSQGGI